MDDNTSVQSLQWDMLDLADHLREERLFVSSEQQHLQELNAKVLSSSSIFNHEILCLMFDLLVFVPPLYFYFLSTGCFSIIKFSPDGMDYAATKSKSETSYTR